MSLATAVAENRQSFWAVCSGGRYNGLLLCAHHDALFDKEIISFDSLVKITVSSLYEKKMNLLQLDGKMQISKFVTNTEIVSNLEFYRKYTFKRYT